MNNFYCRLAYTNMKNNKQFYLPYLITSIVSMMMFYCINALRLNQGLKTVRGANDVIMVMNLGTIVVAAFIAILVFYTNSFVMKRRKKELGVYNILGMEKKHLAKVLFIETVYTVAISVGLGSVLGIVFQKYFSMILYKIMKTKESVPFYVSGESILLCAILFGFVYLLNLIYNIFQIKLANPVELLRSKNAGEKEPKTKWLKAIIGIVALGAGYFLAITVDNPIKALFSFFIAVVLVILGTYALFSAGSIACLKLLRKNKSFYYQTRHFTAVSGLLYRMKQNAVGLSNICILSTMVLVVLGTTTCMYAGIRDFVNSQLEADISVTYRTESIPSMEAVEAVKEAVKESIDKSKVNIIDDKTRVEFAFAGNLDGDNYIYAGAEGSATNYEKTVFVTVETVKEFEKHNNDFSLELKDDEAAWYGYQRYEYDHLLIHGLEFKIADTRIMDKANKSALESVVMDTVTMVVKDDEAKKRIFDCLTAVHDEASIIPKPYTNIYVNYDLSGSDEVKREAEDIIIADASDYESISYVNTDSKLDLYQEYMALHGGIFFLGLFLGFMFLMITVLIIYYKQISEGYEDRERFEIMQKVGMNRAEVKATISSQVRTVFFLPLVTAILHLAVSFPMLSKILALMFISNVQLLVISYILTAIAFAIIYFIVFKMTSVTYLKIVGR